MTSNYAPKKIICQHEIKIYEFTQLQCESVIIMFQGNIGVHAFADSKYLKNVSIYGKGTMLGLGVFSYCSNIRSVQMYDVSGVVLRRAMFCYETKYDWSVASHEKNPVKKISMLKILKKI